VVFSILFGVSLVLIGTNMPEGAKDSSEWLSTQHAGIVTAALLMPFAGISFLWFIGVVRDGFGRYEDRFFATVFLGSGVLFLAMIFAATAVAAALVATNSGVIDPRAHAEVVDFGKMVFLAAAKTYALRMAAVFMISLATIWLKTADLGWSGPLRRCGLPSMKRRGNWQVRAPAAGYSNPAMCSSSSSNTTARRAVPARSGTGFRTRGSSTLLLAPTPAASLTTCSTAPWMPA
jgi:hypothetical protein